MTDISIRTMLLEFMDTNGASHIREMHIEILRRKPDTPEHTIRARLSEAVSDGLLDRLGDGFYDVYAEDEGMTSVVSYPDRMALWGSSSYRGNCDGRLIKDLICRYHARKVADPMEGSGTSRDIVEGLNKYKRAGISFWGGDLRSGFDLTRQNLPGRFDFVWIHPPYWNIVQYRSGASDLSNCESYERFREMLMVCLRRCYEALEIGGRLAVLIGDVRRSGRYTPIVRDVLNFPYGEVRSVIIKVQHVRRRSTFSDCLAAKADQTYCSVSSSLLVHAILVTRWYEATMTMYPVGNNLIEPQGRLRTASTKAVRG